MTTILFGPITWAKTLLRHLWLSVSSIEFYRDVFKVYEGYGIKYIITVSFLSSLFCSIVLLNQIVAIKNYFTYNVISNNVTNIDHIINQFPDLNYDGQTISSLDEKNVIYLTNINNDRVVAIDPANTLSYIERSKIPIVLTSNKIVLSLINPGEKPLYTASLDYDKIFVGSIQTINQTSLKASLSEIFKGAPEVFIYLFFPSIGLLIFFKAIMEKSFIMVVIYLIANILGINAPLKTCVRIVLFASGIFYLLQPLILMLLPNLNIVIWIIQIWSNLLMIIAVLRINKRS